MKITIFRDVKELVTPHYATVDKVIERIKDPNTVARIWSDGDNMPAHDIPKVQLLDLIRKGDKKTAGELKRGLPSILFAGEFPHRKKGAMPINHSGYIILDIDELGEYDMDSLRAVLQGDHYTHCAFVSPSGAGFKVLVKIPADIARHTGYYLGLEHYYKHTYNIKLDPSGKNIGRVCYESYDPNIYYNPDSINFTHCVEQVRESKPKRDSHITEIVAVGDTAEKISRLVKWWQNNYSMSNGRNQTLFILASAFNRYGIFRSDAMQHCYQYEDNREGDPFTRKEIEKVVNNAYDSGSHLFGSEIFEDTTRKQELYTRISGVTEDEGIEQLRQYEELAKLSTSELVELFYEVKEEVVAEKQKRASTRQFWYYDDGNRLKIDNNDLLQFINELGFYLNKRTDAPNDYVLIHIDNNIIKLVDEVEIKHRVMEFVLSKNENIVFNKITDSNKYFSMTFLSGLPIVELPILRDNKECAYFPTPSAVYKITQQGISKIDYLDLTEGYVWQTQITAKDFNFKFNSEEFIDCDFSKFVFGIAGLNIDRWKQLMQSIGYMMHNYKDPAKSKAVVIYDANLDQMDGEPEGGSGKSLLFEGIRKVREVAVIPGDRVDFNRQFALQEIKDSTQIAWIDELKKNADLTAFFSRITNGIPIEKKGKDPIYIENEKAPKFAISTNYKPKGVSGSFMRRLILFAVSNHYNVNHTPIDEFGKAFFQDWDSNEWDNFFTFMLTCVHLYLKDGLPDIRNNDEKLTIINECGLTFADFWLRDNRIEAAFNTGILWLDYEYRLYQIDDPNMNPAKGYTLFRTRVIKMLKVFGYRHTEENINGDTRFNIFR